MVLDPHFVCPADRIWPELLNEPVVQMPPDVLRARSVDGVDCWITRTYYELRLAGRAVTIGPQVIQGRINIAAVRDFGRKDVRPGCFMAIPRLDAHEPKLANFVIYQNSLNGTGPTWDWVPHWGQPDIAPRDPARGTRVETLAFKGASLNLEPSFKSDAFRSELNKLGVQLQIDAIEVHGPKKQNDWGNYSQVDAVLAARNLTQYDAHQKPASKLVNAWSADVPALLGPEPGYHEQKLSDLDFLEVRTPEDVIAAMIRLKRDPQLFSAMVENGRRRRVDFEDAHLRSLWCKMIDGPLTEAFSRWQRSNRLSRSYHFMRGIVAEQHSKAEHARRIHTGRRILG